MAAMLSNRRLNTISSDRNDIRSREPSDEELLTRFLESLGESSADAFEALVHRHGLMVMNACRHVLRAAEDAEDAFQATFLTLARKAASIRDHRCLAGWLHEVAMRIAIQTRASEARRRGQEPLGSDAGWVSSTESHEERAAVYELHPLLHEEVNRLPDKYRLPIILSYLEGRTNEEVAARLGCPVGTVKGRLFRARELLRSRLTRRGIALSAASLLQRLLEEHTSAAPLAESLVERTTRNALAQWSGSPGGQSQGSADSAPSITTTLPAAEERLAPILGRLRPRPRLDVLLFALIALLSVAFAISSVIRNDPHLTRRIKSGFTAVVGTRTPRDCR